MQILYAKSKWERPDASLPDFLAACRADGYDATELYLPAVTEAPSLIAELHRAAGLRLVAQIVTAGATPDEHIASLDQQVPMAAACAPLFINCHTGRDWFGFDANLRILRHAADLARHHGVALHHELHRGRALFNAPDTVRYLDAFPDMTITADFSHWFCVHESDLSDQEAALARTVTAARHIHARIGFNEGPQVADPASPGAAPWLERHLGLWQRIVAARSATGASYLTITPEFGPAPYMPVTGADDTPAADAWLVNRWMRDTLRARLLAG
ncbi:MAG: TIM barrel protein [Pseudomonadota bacterium]